MHSPTAGGMRAINWEQERIIATPACLRMWSTWRSRRRLVDIYSYGTSCEHPEEGCRGICSSSKKYSHTVAGSDRIGDDATDALARASSAAYVVRCSPATMASAVGIAEAVEYQNFRLR